MRRDYLRVPLCATLAALREHGISNGIALSIAARVHSAKGRVHRATTSYPIQHGFCVVDRGEVGGGCSACELHRRQWIQEEIAQQRRRHRGEE